MYRYLKSLTTLALLAITVLSVSGCFYSREIVHTRRDIARTYPSISFDRGISMSFGPVSIGTARWIVGLVPDDDAEEVHDYLRDVSRLKVGYYQVEHLPSDLSRYDVPSLRRFERGGWEVAVRTRDRDDVVWVLYREHHDTIRDLYVIVLSDEDLVLARVQGHLNRILRRAMEENLDFSTFIN